MIHIPILRNGVPYESVETSLLVHHATGRPIARVSQANSGMVTRDVCRMDDAVLERFTVTELLGLCKKAAEVFMTATLPIGEASQSFDDYLSQLSATTGMPVGYCRANAEKIRRVLAEMETILAGLTRGFDLGILDRGYGTWQSQTTATSAETSRSADQPGSEAPAASEAHTVSFFREGRIFGAVLPSNSPGVHGLWLPAVALKAPIVLKPGREEPWTPYRIIEALAAAGVPRAAFGFYPTNHAGAGELLRSVDRAMLFGGSATTDPWKDDPRVEIHGPGFSKVLLGDDVADDWERYLDLMESSILANGGRSCINASAVWTPRHGRDIADALAERLARVEALPVDDPRASVAAFANPVVSEGISAVINRDLRIDGAVDLTDRYRATSATSAQAERARPTESRGNGRLVTVGRCAYLLPTVIWCEDRGHPLANREFLFPYASVVECPVARMPEAIGPSLVVTALTNDEAFKTALMSASNVDRLNLGPIPTWRLSWDQPHEGNLFEHLYRQRALQIESAA